MASCLWDLAPSGEQSVSGQPLCPFTVSLHLGSSTKPLSSPCNAWSHITQAPWEQVKQGEQTRAACIENATPGGLSPAACWPCLPADAYCCRASDPIFLSIQLPSLHMLVWGQNIGSLSEAHSLPSNIISASPARQLFPPRPMSHPSSVHSACTKDGELHIFPEDSKECNPVI